LPEPASSRMLLEVEVEVGKGMGKGMEEAV
jgi:hypothetical protein